MIMKKYSAILMGLLVVFYGCDKQKNTPPPSSAIPLNISVQFKVDQAPLVFDSMMYYNQAGNHYSIVSLLFYLSEFTLIRNDGSEFMLKEYQYVDAGDGSTTSFTINNVPRGCYTALHFNIGVDSLHNVENGLPINAENLSMDWPVVMGGGYHFLKHEGYFEDSSASYGYAMHLGTNACLVKIQLPVSICMTENAVSKNLVMNVNEWFCNPYTYNLNIDGNNIMGNPSAMQKIAGNGSDVFTIQ
jgi:hypothetical protein